MSIQEQLRSLIERHRATIQQNVARIGYKLAEVHAPDGDPSGAVIEAEALAHQLKGSSGSAGFGNVSDAAKVLDDRLKALSRANEADIMTAMPRVHELYEDLQKEASSITPESSALFHADLSAFGKRDM